MPKILTQIDPQAFELIRDQIAAILADELNYQGVLKSDNDLLKIKVYVESINPEDKEDLPIVNVCLAHGEWPDRKSYDGKIKGNYTYNIDFYTNSPTDDNDEGDKLSGVKLQKLMGISRAILENPIYRILGYNPGFVERVGLKDLNIRLETKNTDALNTRMGRLTFLVEVQESVDLLTGQPLQQWTAAVSINNTSDGHYFQANY